jgi:hypothetical protein
VRGHVIRREDGAHVDELARRRLRDSAATVTATGVIDFRAQRAAITMRALSAGRTMVAEARVVDGVVWTSGGSGCRCT